jgi:hypothetical protein
LQKGAQVLLAPGIIDDQEDTAVAQGRAQCQEEVPGLLAELRPEYPIEISIQNVGVMGNGLASVVLP